MKLKRTVALFLALLMMLSMLAACDNGKKEGNDTTADTPPQDVQNGPGIDLSAYTVIRSGDASTELSQAVVKMSQALAEMTGKKIAVRNDEMAADSGSPEILVGDTNRPQSAAAKKAMTALGYSISVDGNKIVIVASNDTLLEDALVAFTSSALTRLDNGNYELAQNGVEVEYNVVKLTENQTSNYSVVFAEDDPKYNKELALEFATELKNAFGCKVSVYGESNTTSLSTKAIYLGNVANAPEKTLAYYQSGVMRKGDAIYLSAWNRDGLSHVCFRFISRLQNKGKNSVSIQLPVSTLAWNNNDIQFNAPLPEKVSYSGANTVANNGIVLSYENVPANVYDSYLALLEANGYTSYYSRQASTNRFAGYCKGDEGVWVYYLADLKELRVTLEPYSSIPTFSADGAKVTEASLVQFGLRYTSIDKGPTLGMSYVITLEDGRYVIVDGGRDDAEKYGLADKLYNHLKNNNKRNDGKIKVAAWILTHSHSDHYDTFQEFGTKYGNTVELEYLLWNVPTANSVLYAENVDNYLYDHVNQFKSYFKNSKAYTLHTGYAFSVGGVEFEFLSTYEDIYPNALTEMNDTCLTFRATFNSGETDEAKAIFLADIYKAHGDRLAEMWGSYLRTPIVQVAHHGWDNGGSQKLYNEIRAAYGLWSNSNQHLNHGSAYGAYIRKMLVGIKGTIKFYSNCDASGNAQNTVITFDGSIKITTVAQ